MFQQRWSTIKQLLQTLYFCLGPLVQLVLLVYHNSLLRFPLKSVKSPPVQATSMRIKVPNIHRNAVCKLVRIVFAYWQASCMTKYFSVLQLLFLAIPKEGQKCFSFPKSDQMLWIVQKTLEIVKSCHKSSAYHFLNRKKLKDEFFRYIKLVKLIMVLLICYFFSWLLNSILCNMINSICSLYFPTSMKRKITV